jgi:hypothetical protein
MARRAVVNKTESETNQPTLVASLFKNTTQNKYDLKGVMFESGEVKELTDTELNNPIVIRAIELGILEAQ